MPVRWSGSLPSGTNKTKYLEPLVVIFLLFGGAWINRSRYGPSTAALARCCTAYDPFSKDEEDLALAQARPTPSKRSLSPSLLPSQENAWRERHVRLFGHRRTVYTPNTAKFRNRFLSRVLQKFPFLVEAWYWALIYWVYQLGRAFTAVTIVEGTVHVARKHALQLIEIEKRWHVFWEIPIQRFFMSYPQLMRGINWLYSFIHIPGTIAFLVWLFYYTIISSRPLQAPNRRMSADPYGSPSAHLLYESRRRTMAACNLIAFVVFTLWPCMPPRLLSDPGYQGPDAVLAQSYGFVDSVHGAEGASSVWTQNKFCNQYAAMPSLHFGYSLLVGMTIATIPLAPKHSRARSIQLPLFNQSHPELAPRIRFPSTRRLACVVIGIAYPYSILIAIVATANHFILDAVAGALVCFIGWNVNDVLLNLLPIEDYFLWCLRIHKPVHQSFENVNLLGWTPYEAGIAIAEN